VSLPAHQARPETWADAWPDAAAFCLGLGLAWWQNWSTTDLIWSLWLSSLVVGYGMILWQLTGPMRELVVGMRADRSGVGAGPKLLMLAVFAVGTLFGVVFFTVHFGGCHFGHSIFLNFLFPLSPRPARGLVDFTVYAEVAGRYWWFIPAAFLAERRGFQRFTRDEDKAVTPEAIRARKAKGDAMTAPYRNVIRMHLLIFFFAFAHFARLENFVVYAVIYAVCFFPWRLVRRGSAPAPAAR
jgi:hypothetical protein